MHIPESALPSFPDRALPSKAVLYRPLQDIDIYVEDEGSEVFYTELLRRLLEGRARIATVVPLRGRENVLKRCFAYQEPRAALFLIDGDLHWVAGLSLPACPNLYVHPCYCVENYLFCERAMIQIVVENTGALKDDEAARQLNWADTRARLERHFIPLFVDFAVAFALCPNIRTVSRGIGSVLRDSTRGVPAELDTDKADAVRQEVVSEVVRQKGLEAYVKARTEIAEQVRVLADPLDAVSGKDFLVPIQMFEAGRVGGQKVQRKSFVFRLARHCSLDKLAALRRRIIEALKPNNCVQVTLASSRT